MKPKIVVTKNFKLYPDQIERLNSLGEVTFYKDQAKTPEEWLERCKDQDIICSGIFGTKSEKLFELKDVFISLPLVGVEFLDRKRLKENNISAANAPGCNKESVAEWIMGMILIQFRNLHQLTRTKDNKDQTLKTTTSLYNKNITILGKGNIGTQLGKICGSLDMKVTFFTRGDNLANSVKDADIVVNCLSTNPTTECLLNKEFFFSLKKGSFFVSISRSQIYDINALKEALDKDILIGAADDSASAEVGDVNDPAYKELLDHPKIQATPHISWNTDAEKRIAMDMMIDNIEAWINKKPINLIN